MAQVSLLNTRLCACCVAVQPGCIASLFAVQLNERGLFSYARPCLILFYLCPRCFLPALLAAAMPWGELFNVAFID